MLSSECGQVMLEFQRACTGLLGFAVELLFLGGYALGILSVQSLFAFQLLFEFFDRGGGLLALLFNCGLQLIDLGLKFLLLGRRILQVVIQGCLLLRCGAFLLLEIRRQGFYAGIECLDFSAQLLDLLR